MRPYENATLDHSEFWKSIGKIGIGQTKKKYIPMEVVGETGKIDNDITNVLNKWKQDFSSLLNPSDGNSPILGTIILILKFLTHFWIHILVLWRSKK